MTLGHFKNQGALKIDKNLNCQHTAASEDVGITIYGNTSKLLLLETFKHDGDSSQIIY